MNTPRSSSLTNPLSLVWLFCVASIFSLSIFGTSLQQWLFSMVSRKAILPIASCITPLLILYLFMNRKKLAIGLPALIGVCTLILFGILAVHLKYLRPVELTHFYLFSTLGWLSVTAFGPRIGLVLVLCIATGDEILQHFLPTRIGDLHDIIINNTSGLAGVFLGLKNHQSNPT